MKSFGQSCENNEYIEIEKQGRNWLTFFWKKAVKSVNQSINHEIFNGAKIT